MRLEGKVAIVTGGGIGIGKEISLGFAREGADVVVAARTESALKEVVSEIEAIGRKGLAIVTDLTIPEQIMAMVDRALGEFNKVDILVNNSGIAGPYANVADMDWEAWNEVLAVNLTGTMLCAKHVLNNSMLHRKSGNIINVSSGLGRTGVPMRTPYVGSKWGVIGFTQALAWEVGKYGIRVNCIVPGPVEGERVEQAMKAQAKVLGVSYEEMEKRFRARSPMGRLVKPEEIAACAVFLASEQSSGITGQTINCAVGTVMN